MGVLVNHPGMFLNDEAAASLERYEMSFGVQPLTDAGRTEKEQQELIDRWFRGGPANRPPNLYEPRRPARESDHVKNGGEAIDNANWQHMRIYGKPYGWVADYEWDKVHFRYDARLDLFKDDDMFNDDDRKAVKAILDRVNGALPGPENGRGEYGRVLDTGDGQHILDVIRDEGQQGRDKTDYRTNDLADWTRRDASTILSAMTTDDGLPVHTDEILTALRKLPALVIAELKAAL